MLGLAGYTKSKIKIMPSGYFSDFFYQKTQLAPEYIQTAPVSSA
jgi:hypothetical protein